MSRRRTQIARLLALAALLLLPAAASAQSCLSYGAYACFGKNKIQYRRFDWAIYHSTHFDIWYYPEEEEHLQRVASTAESAYDQLSRQLDHQITEPIKLIVYETHAAFEQNNIILNFIPEGIGAFAVPSGGNRMVLPIDLPAPELQALMLHELTHVFQFDIIYQGRAAKAFTAGPPQWFWEGMASYFGQDESARDKGFLRDAVVNDNIPPITELQGGGFFAYRFGHAVFDYLEERWGIEGVRDFVFEVRNTLGGSVGKALERSFGEDPEDFDADFRRWLRRKYLPELVDSGEPGDFGRPFRRPQTIFSGQMTSPAASPSGDLIAAFSTHKGDVDVVLYDARERTLLRNLTKGFDQKFEYLVAQEMTLGRKMGRDLAFSPDGNYIALFARQGEWRKLVILDVLHGGKEQVIDLDGVDQPYGPAWSPDGRKVAFSGYRDNRFDIFAVDVTTGEVTHVTDDDVYDASPVYAPDGRSMVLTSVLGGYANLYRIDLDNPSERVPLTSGETNDTDAVFSPDGSELFFTSDRTGADNIYGLDLASGEVTQYTNAVSIVFQPTVIPGLAGEPDSLVYAAFWNGRFDLYKEDLDEPITSPEVVEAGKPLGDAKPLALDELSRFQPSIEVAIDDANKEEVRPFKFFLEDIDFYVGVSDDQTFIGQSIISFSDYLGDRRIQAAFQSIESFQNFTAVYLDLSHRFQWGARLFDDEDFFIVYDVAGDLRRQRSAIKTTGADGFLVFPINTNHRVETSLGYRYRDLNVPLGINLPLENFDLEDLLTIFPVLEPILVGLTPEQVQQVLELTFPGGVPIVTTEPRTDDYPQVGAQLIGDTAVFAPWGPITGRRWLIGGYWAPDTTDSGTLDSLIEVDFRQYLKVTARSNFAIRLWGGMADGNAPTPLVFGGLDTVRGFDFRSLAGDRGFFANFEFRFPLVDQLATPVFRFGGIRGIVFLDVGGAWFDDFQDFDFWDSENDRLDDAVSSYGYGLTARLFGLDVNWDFAKRWDFDRSVDGFETSFWIGTRF
ncbi:MAG: ShlB/FhaC/HecB family hemolysin secretion/activation protein [Thermoanaerobaculia bacterium]